jgi:autotransporter-associated beta strand protein
MPQSTRSENTDRAPQHIRHRHRCIGALALALTCLPITGRGQEIDTVYDAMDQVSPWQVGGAAAGASTLTASTNISTTGLGSLNLSTTFSSGQTFVDLYWDSIGTVDFSQNLFRLDFRTSDTNAMVLWRLGTQEGPVYETLGKADSPDTFTTLSYVSSQFSGVTENLSHVNLIQLRFFGDNIASLPAAVDFFVDNLRIDAYRSVDSGQTSSFTNAITGSGGFYKAGTGTLVLAASNNFTGAVEVSAGVLDLSSETGSAAGSATAVSVAASATLLVSQNNQVHDSAAVTLSGGTIQRASGVSEVFGDLNLTASSFIDFGIGTTGTLSFQTYTPSSLLTVENFLPGNALTFANNFTSQQIAANFSFDGDFITNWDGTTFTITAIPEASTIFAATVLLLMLAAPSWSNKIRGPQDSRHQS